MIIDKPNNLTLSHDHKETSNKGKISNLSKFWIHSNEMIFLYKYTAFMYRRRVKILSKI